MAVEQEHLHAGFLSRFQNLVPAGRLSGGNQDVLNALGDEAVGSLQLLVGGGGGDEGRVIAVLGGERIGQVLDIGFTIAGLRGVQVDDANLDAVSQGGAAAQRENQREGQNENLLHCEIPPFVIAAFVPFTLFILPQYDLYVNAIVLGDG